MRRRYLNEIKQNFKNYNPWILSLLLADDVIQLASSGSGFQLIQSSLPSVKQQELWESRPLSARPWLSAARVKIPPPGLVSILGSWSRVRGDCQKDWGDVHI